MKLAELMKDVDKFISKYGTTPADKDQMKSDLMDIVQKSVELGEGKDQNKITGIATGILKQFFPFGKKD